MGNPEHNLAEQVPCVEALVQLRCVGEASRPSRILKGCSANR